MKSDNPVRNLRLALKLNQVEFGRLIGRSHQSVRNYENGIGKIPSSDVIEKMKTLAAEKGWAHLALELTSDDWHARHIIEPGEILISTQRPALSAVESLQRQSWHALLDALLDSGDEDGVPAVKYLLRYFERQLAATQSKAKRQASPKT